MSEEDKKLTCYICGREVRWVEVFTENLKSRQIHIEDKTYAGLGSCEHFSFIEELEAL